LLHFFAEGKERFKLKRIYKFIFFGVVLLTLFAACSLYDSSDEPEPDPSSESNQPNEANQASDDEQPTSQQGDTSAFEEDTCPFDLSEGQEEQIQCGYLYVPEDHNDPQGPEIKLAVAIIRSLSNQPAADPIIYLDGGPGGSALADPDSWLESPLRDDRDIILLDQRGTGYSLPSLNCIELEENEEDALAATQACRDRLANAGVNLSAYNSANNAADVNELRLALGYEEWNMIGISYGTRLALTTMRDFPTGIRSVVLDSVYPPNIDAYSEQPLNNADAIQAMIDGCGANGACNEAYPELEKNFYELIAQLNEQPVDLDGEELTGDQIVDQLVQTLYDTYTIPELPRIIHAASEEEYDPLLDLINQADQADGASRQRPRQESGGDITDSEGMFYSVECYEEIPFGNVAEAERLVSKYPSQLAEGLLAGLQQEYEACEIWNVGQAGQIETEAVSSDIPTLVLVGEYDPVTPPHWAKLAAETLSNHQYFEIPAGGHALMDAGECPLGLIVSFIADPTTQLDGSCVAELEPTFALR